MKVKILLGVLSFVIVIAGLAAYVAITVGSELYRARAALSGDTSDLDESAIDSAEEHLRAALERTDSWPARILKIVPIARQNVIAVEDVARAALPVLDAGRALNGAISELEDERLIVDGRVRLSLLRPVGARLRSQASSLAGLEEAVRAGRSGWALPPLWNALDDLLATVGGFRSGADNAAAAVELSSAVLGVDGGRRYLVILMNNAELRGAGGIPSAIGTLSARDGALELGRFHYATDLRGPRPYDRVGAPPDFRRRFAQYLADTTFWVNTTFSPDVPDVAVVAARLFTASTGIRTDGVLFIDPRGVQALMPPGSGVAVPGTDRTVAGNEFATYVYSTVYEEVRDQVSRRRALLALGRAAFGTILDRGFGDRSALEAAGRAIAGAHLRFVSFDDAERESLAALGVSGEIDGPERDSLLVTAQNLGGDKLDHWSRRAVEHVCGIEDGSARCVTEVAVANRVPDGLPSYVAGRPYGLLKNYVEVYIPASARLRAVTVDGRPADFVPQDEDDLRAIGVNLQIAPGEITTIAVDYEIAAADEWSLAATPQPLTRDARLRIEVAVPGGWSLRAEGATVDGAVAYDGPFDRRITVTAAPSGRTGLARLWDGIERFWREPLF